MDILQAPWSALRAARGRPGAASSERAVSLSPRSPDARMAKGGALLAMGLRREAVAEMRESARIHDGADVRTRIAGILRGLEDHAGELDGCTENHVTSITSQASCILYLFLTTRLQN